jgi:hypothetical protein
LQLRWISAAEGKEFAEKLREMDEVVRRYVRKLRGEAVPAPERAAQPAETAGGE